MRDFFYELEIALSNGFFLLLLTCANLLGIELKEDNDGEG